MTNGVFVLVKRPDIGREEFGTYWRVGHAAVAQQIPGLCRYVQNHLRPGFFEGKPPCDGVAELWWDSPEAFQAAMVAPEGQATVVDLSKFCDTARSKAVLADEVPLV